jgi:hypothetical protein
MGGAAPLQSVPIISGTIYVIMSMYTYVGKTFFGFVAKEGYAFATERKKFFPASCCNDDRRPVKV